MSPILPLTIADSLLLSALIEREEQQKRNLYLLLADIGYFLSRISGALTGSDGLVNELPSSLARMTARLEETKKRG